MLCIGRYRYWRIVNVKLCMCIRCLQLDNITWHAQEVYGIGHMVRDVR